MSSSSLLEIHGITKSYPGVIANEDVKFTIKTGEIHALLGENGAGKSTLVKTIYGLVKPDKGLMKLNGNLYSPNEPRDARSCGVAMVFQHFSLFNALSVAENIALGMESPPSMDHLSNKIETVSIEYGLPINPEKMVGNLSAGEQQRVEIIRCLLQNPKLLIMDEPTSVLTPNEIKTLFNTLKKLKSEGTSILYISHKLEDIRSICDTATILRGGKNVGTCDPKKENVRNIAEMMIGDTIKIPKKKSTISKLVALEVDCLNWVPNDSSKKKLKNISFKLLKGEILGIGGVAGNGQDELTEILSGEVLSNKNTIRLFDKPIGDIGINKRRLLGLLTAPEERLGHAAIPDMDLIENTNLTAHTRENFVKKSGIIDWKKTQEFAQNIIKEFDVRTPNAKVAAGSLSGGNLQKFVIGREVLQKPLVFIVNQPTWGVDAAAASSIRQAILDLASTGSAVIIISQDLDELLELTDNFMAINSGKMSQKINTQGLTVDEIGLMIGGTGAYWKRHD